jgi:general secretion pathway protein L
MVKSLTISTRAWGRSLERLYRWWIGELAEALPPGLRRALWGGRQRVWLELDADELVVSRDGPEGREPLARYRLEELDRPVPAAREAEGREVMLVLPAERVLEKVLTLPLAAEENLAQVLAFEMDRQTPFKASQVYYAFRTEGRDAAARTLRVRLTLVLRPYLDELLGRLGRAGLQPAQAGPAQADSARGIGGNLLPPERRPRRSLVPRLANLSLGLAAVALAVAVLALPLLAKRQAIEVLRPLVAEAEEKAKAARALEQDLRDAVAHSQFLIDKKRSAQSVLEVLNEMTRLLPDDTWSTRFDLQGGEVQVQGESNGAAMLIPLLDGSPLFNNVRFRSPVTQDPRVGIERFHLSAEVRREGGA